MSGIYWSHDGVLIATSSVKSSTFLYNPNYPAVQFIGNPGGAFHLPVNIMENFYIYKGFSFYYVDRAKQDSGYLEESLDPLSIGRFVDALDFDHSKYYFLTSDNINGATDGVYNFYMIDSNLTLTQLNDNPIDSPSYVSNSIFIHNEELYYFVTINFRYYIRRFTTEQSADIAKVHRELNLYPNPAKNIITANSNSQINTVDVLNTKGQIIYSNIDVQSQTLSIDISAFPKGLYFIRVKDKSSVLLSKFVKE